MYSDNTILGALCVPAVSGGQTELEMSMDSNRILKVKATPPAPLPVGYLKIASLGVCVVWCFCWRIKI
jgi:hypothetical protein